MQGAEQRCQHPDQIRADLVRGTRLQAPVRWLLAGKILCRDRRYDVCSVDTASTGCSS
jgi:hypothetical protein